MRASKDATVLQKLGFNMMLPSEIKKLEDLSVLEAVKLVNTIESGGMAMSDEAAKKQIDFYLGMAKGIAAELEKEAISLPNMPISS